MKAYALRIFPVIVALALLSAGCKSENATFADPSDRPIGVFDSGTGGLTVLDKLLTLDLLDNEDFQYLADQANMPYGVYDSQGKSDLLRRLVKDDARFLTGDRYWKNAAEAAPTGIKQPCKIVVIACNTATAYGLADVSEMLGESGIRVIGVINAGVKATLDRLGFTAGRRGGEQTGSEVPQSEEPFAIGVLATPGTISSGAYERTIREELARRGITTPVTIVNQAGYGFAEAVDAEPDFVDPKLTAPRSSYRGPRIGTADNSIKEELLPRYNFDPAGLLYREVPNNIPRAEGMPFVPPFDLMTDIQLNSAANYARFNMVSLIERHRLSGSKAPLRAIILGCTHYPFELETLEKVVSELRSFRFMKDYPYRDLLPADLMLIDPARYTAVECYEALRADSLLRQPSRKAVRTVRGYISVPAAGLDPGFLTPDGGLSFEYKYGRDSLAADTGTRQVPFSKENISPATRDRIKALLPATAGAILPED